MKHIVLKAPEGMRYTDGEGYYVEVYVGEGKQESDYELVPAPAECEAEEVPEIV